MEPGRGDLYRILQVDPAANALIVQAAYRVLARIFHPDVEGDDAEMKRINAAWEVLGDPRRRKQYDIERAGRHPGAAAAPISAPAPDPAWRRQGATTGPSQAGSTGRADLRAGPPPGAPFGPIIRVGRYAGWSIGQIARVDRPFLEWLRQAQAGRTIKGDIDAVLSTRKGPEAVDERRHYETIRGRASAPAS